MGISRKKSTKRRSKINRHKTKVMRRKTKISMRRNTRRKVSRRKVSRRKVSRRKVMGGGPKVIIYDDEKTHELQLSEKATVKDVLDKIGYSKILSNGEEQIDANMARKELWGNEGLVGEPPTIDLTDELAKKWYKEGTMEPTDELAEKWYKEGTIHMAITGDSAGYMPLMAVTKKKMLPILRKKRKAEQEVQINSLLDSSAQTD